MQIPELGSVRRLWVYLPEDYAIASRRYPVLYMQDGQNLFDTATSFSGEWEIDEYLDRIAAQLMVVGIDNGGERRINEYNPNDNESHGPGLGRQYLQRISFDLKPYIDHHFRTLPDAAHTAIAGSSMGGLISFYAGLYHPQVFGLIGALSPSFWMVPDLEAEVKANASTTRRHQRYYLFGGSNESEDLVARLHDAALWVKQYLDASADIEIAPKANHSEATWRRCFPAFYHWLKTGFDAASTVD